MAGFLLAAFSLTLFSHWLALLLGLLGIDTGKPKGRVPRRRLALIPLMALHPTSWLFSAVPYFTYQAVDGHLERGWVWLIGGFYLGLVGLGLVTYVTARKIRKQQLARMTPNNALEQTRDG
jgi:hypothetical protein